jgi:transposase, IS30 family
MKRTYSQINLNERCKIARWRMAGNSVGIIAAKLGWHRSIIFREIKRNTFVHPQISDLNGCYCITPTR